jgi:hypothetical protein
MRATNGFACDVVLQWVFNRLLSVNYTSAVMAVGLTAIVQCLLASGWPGMCPAPEAAGSAPTHCEWSVLGV